MTLEYLHGIETIENDDGIRPIQTVKSSVIGLIGTAPAADAAKYPLNEPVLILGDRRQYADLGATGTLPDAMDGIFDQIGAAVVMLRVEEGVDVDATMANIIGSNADDTGVHAFTKAESHVGYAPRIWCAPGFTSQRPSNGANPVVSEMRGIADRRRAVIVADGPNTTKEAAQTYADDFGSDRIYVIDPACRVRRGVADVIEPMSARGAGMIAKRDLTKGFWWSPSNEEINGILGPARDIDYALSDPISEGNFLNEHQVATIIRRNGFRLFGNKSLASDPNWQFLSVRRTADMVYESVEEAHFWALDRPYSTQLLVDIAESVNAYLRILKSRGAILGGRAWLDPELNPPAQLKAGQVMVSYDLEPPAPAERITFVAYRNDDYYTEMTEAAAREIALLAA
ncbi:MAG: phage tail sheath C-terminal domain-containing protein [Pseudomonadota bacterium]